MRRPASAGPSGSIGLVVFPSAHEHEIRPLLIGRDGAGPQISLPDPERDEFAVPRKVTGHRSPSRRIVKPRVGDLRLPAGCFEVASSPETRGGRAVPLAVDPEAHAERVLNGAKRGRRVFGPGAWPGS